MTSDKEKEFGAFPDDSYSESPQLNVFLIRVTLVMVLLHSIETLTKTLEDLKKIKTLIFGFTKKKLKIR